MRPYKEHFQNKIDKLIRHPDSWSAFTENEQSLLRMIERKKL